MSSYKSIHTGERVDDAVTKIPKNLPVEDSLILVKADGSTSGYIPQSQVAGNKLDKQTAQTETDQIYGKLADGSQTMFDVTMGAEPTTIPRRDAAGRIQVADGVSDGDVVNFGQLKGVITDLNIQNGTGENSLIQKAPDGKENTAAMEGGIAFGKNSHANQKYDFAIGGANAIAGFTKEQFNSYYWDGTQALHGGKGKDSDGNILDFTGSKYEDSFGYNFAVGDTAIANGRNAVAFQQGKAYGRESVAFGTATADGEQSFAINNGYASGYDSFSQGSNTVAKYAQQAVFGRWNENKEDDIFEVGVGSGEPDPMYGLPETKNAFEITKTGKVKVLNEPSENNEVVRKQELDTKYDKTGGTIGGNVIITGDLTINGTEHINNVENLNVKNAMIYSNADGATLAQNGGIGIKTNTSDVYGIVYDPTSDSVKLGLGKSDVNGVFTFNSDEGQPVAVRDDSSLLVNNNLVKWDATNHKLVDSGKSVGDFVDKLSASVKNQAYVRNADGEDTGLAYTYTDEGNTLALRNASGQVQVSDPSQDKDAANKLYADNLNARYVSTSILGG